ncbi:hypothetical protein [Planctomonas psychrotolerans]|uniref:hypothetical protein n=1 Tax=Planctomonas psychrotolerans TaxID=2528712 RepID=UPI001239EA4F|nr:hypothetical protein [Planctomonas psychrotolerans]
MSTHRAATASKTKGILSLVFGIISIVFCLFLPILWIFFGIAAVILGVISRKNEPGAAKIALAGIITGSIGIVLNIASMVLGAVLVAQYMQ